MIQYPGIIISIKNNLANVKIDKFDTIISNVKINPNLEISEGDHIWVGRFQRCDKHFIVWAKRVVS